MRCENYFWVEMEFVTFQVLFELSTVFHTQGASLPVKDAPVFSQFKFQKFKNFDKVLESVNLGLVPFNWVSALSPALTLFRDENTRWEMNHAGYRAPSIHFISKKIHSKFKKSFQSKKRD